MTDTFILCPLLTIIALFLGFVFGYGLAISDHTPE